MARAERTDPKLWEKVKDEVTEGDKGGEPGQWSARKAQMAVQEYKKRGGGYSDSGPRQKDTDLHAWTEADWGTRSGRESGASGERYLPKKARMLLTEDEYKRSTAKKRRDTQGKGEQFSGQPKDVREKVSRIRESGPTKAMLDERAGELGIEGRSSMSKDRLLKEIERATGSTGRGKAGGGGGRSDGGRARKGGGNGGSGLEAMTRAELYRRARKAEVEGRSSMSKDELIRALKR